MPGDGLVARQLELEQIDAFLDAVPAGISSAISITGPAGIGKTSVWREGVRRAQASGFLALCSRPSQAEARLSFAGLADLLAPVEPAAFDDLPPLQRGALDVALLRAEAGSPRVTGLAVATGLLSLLRWLTDSARVLVAVDDAQWLDTATAEALAFALRRLEDRPICVLVSVRVQAERPSTFECALQRHRRRDIALMPLNVAALHAILKAETGRAFSRPLLTQIVSASGGNPFYALEIARELGRVGIPPAGGRLPVPEEVRTLVRFRLERLPHSTREALLLASCLWRPTTALVDSDALSPAEEAEIVQVDERGRISFVHPLLASAVYESASSVQRRRVHRSVADRVADPEERARHLALGSTSADAAVAEALDGAVLYAAGRGGASSAAELAELALRLTPRDRLDERVRRGIALGNLLYIAGDIRAAIAALETALEEAPTGPARTQTLIDLGGIYTLVGEQTRGAALVDEAIEGTDDPLLAAHAHARRAWISQLDLEAMIEHSRAVLELIEEHQAPAVYSFALQYLACGLLFAGKTARHEMIERSLRGQKDADEWTISSIGPRWPIFFDDFTTARTRHEEHLTRANESGNESERQVALAYLAQIQLWTGHPDEAHALASESLELAEQIDQEPMACVARYILGLIGVHRGLLEDARALAMKNLTWIGSPPYEAAFILATQTHSVLGSLAFAEGSYEEADRSYSLADEASSRWPEPAPFRYHADHAETVIALGALDRAEVLVSRMELRAARIPRPWLSAVAARSRSLLLAARGDLDAALLAIGEALEHHAELEMPLERARTVLSLGQLLRRRKERRAARAAFQEALADFDRLGASLWAKQARAELARVPVRRAPGDLTPTEEKVASLAATGLTNRVIAERIFISPKTVEANLARVYRKLGIHSRAELGRAMTEREPIHET